MRKYIISMYIVHFIAIVLVKCIFHRADFNLFVVVICISSVFNIRWWITLPL